MRWVDDLMRVSVSASTMVRAKQERNNADVSHLLPQLRVPTLVLHALGDRMNSFEHGRHLASSIRGARLVALESQNHILLEDEPAWPVFLDEVERFLAPDRAKSARSARSQQHSTRSPIGNSRCSPWPHRAVTTRISLERSCSASAR